MDQGGSQTPSAFSKGILCPSLLASYGSKALPTDTAPRACPSQSLGRHSSPASRTATPFSSKHWPPSPIKSETISFHLWGYFQGEDPLTSLHSVCRISSLCWHPQKPLQLPLPPATIPPDPRYYIYGECLQPWASVSSAQYYSDPSVPQIETHTILVSSKIWVQKGKHQNDKSRLICI